MSTIVPFRRREPEDPHMTGEARCLSCQHVWVAVAPIGTAYLECPSCTALKGFWRNLCDFVSADSILYCTHCGNQALTAAKYSGKVHLMCMGCGVDQTDAVFNG